MTAFGVRLRWDAWNVPHIARPGVTQEEVEEACAGETVQLQGHDQRTLLIGRTRGSRTIVVVLESEVLDVYYVVTPRPASRPERRRYNQEKGDDD